VDRKDKSEGSIKPLIQLGSSDGLNEEKSRVRFRVEIYEKKLLVNPILGTGKFLKIRTPKKKVRISIDKEVQSGGQNEDKKLNSVERARVRKKSFIPLILYPIYQYLQVSKFLQVHN